MRVLFGFFTLAALAANAQQAWTWQRPSQAMGSVALDAIETTSGWAISSGEWQGNVNVLAPGIAAFLDPQGNQISETSTIEAGLIGATSFILRDPQTEQLLFGGHWRDLSIGSSGLVQFTFTPSGALSGTRYLHFPEFGEMRVKNAAVLTGDSILWGSSGHTQGSYFPNRMVPFVSTFDGDSISSASYGSGLQGTVTNQLGRWRGSIWISAEGWTPGLLSGYARFLTWNDTLGLGDGFGTMDLANTIGSGLDSVLTASLDIIEISDQLLLTGGCYGNLGTGYRNAVAIYEYGGSLAGRRLFNSGYTHDRPAFHESITRTPSGDLYFAAYENAQISPSFYEPFEPNRLHVFKLDTALNILCEHVVDGFAENAYYHLNRIKATSDGGYLLVGGRKDMSDPANNHFEAWVRKFGPDDCTVGMEEHEKMEVAVVFPNPGREGFTLLLNGPAINGSVQLHDAQGRLLSTTPLWQGQAQVGALEFAAGLYHYRVLDGAGRPVASGRWVKQ